MFRLSEASTNQLTLCCCWQSCNIYHQHIQFGISFNHSPTQ
nr:MAG TPA: hypothetical protein [Caudoviricetes sp.]